MGRDEVVAVMGAPSGEYTVANGGEPQLWWADRQYDFRAYLDLDGRVLDLVGDYDRLDADGPAASRLPGAALTRVPPCREGRAVENAVVILFAAIVPAPLVLRAVERAVGGDDGQPLGLRPLEDVNLPIARFGNATSEDADRLIGTLATAADELEPAAAVTRRRLGRRDARRADPGHRGPRRGRVPAPAVARHRRRRPSGCGSCWTAGTSPRSSPWRRCAPGRPSGIDAAAAALATFESDSWLLTGVSIRKQTYGNDGSSEELAQIPLGGA